MALRPFNLRTVTRSLLGGVVAVVLIFVSPSLAADFDPSKLPPASDRKIDFVKDVQPIFAAHCYGCHGPTKQKGDLRFDAKTSSLKEGSHGLVIKPGDSAGSLLIRAVSHLDPRLQMPAEGKPLTKEQVGILRAWIDQGAEWPDSASVSLDVSRPEHWAFKPVVRPETPAVTTNREWARNPIDSFILARLEREKMSVSAEADKATLIRRLSFDLIGLPPTPEEIDAFVADKSPDTYEKLVDRLLASPRYGERWARHWLDVVRFADSSGFERNQVRPNAWRYRDYVIRSFNDDKPYDQFVREQIAGDHFGAEEGTGFLVGGAADLVKGKDPTLAAQQRADELHDMVATTGSAFLGLTVGCARCHDHKFDPVSHVDYHRLKAVFAGVTHAERPIKSATLVTPDDAAMIASIQTRLREIDEALVAFEPIANPKAQFTLVDDANTAILAPVFQQPTAKSKLASDADADPDDDSASVSSDLPPAATATKASYGGGSDRGRLDDPGSATHLPVLGRGFLSWKKVANQDIFTWQPGVAGRHRLWVSWACGRSGHTGDAAYSLDVDGDLQTTADRLALARTDQRRFAGGGGPVAVAALWSGFFDLGVHNLTSASKVVLTGGSMAKSTVTADLLLLETIPDDAGTSPTSPARFPALREPIRATDNIDRFAPVAAKFVRFTSLESTDGAPGVDRIEVFAPGTNRQRVAVADALSWTDRGTVIELPSAMSIDRIVWGHNPKSKSTDVIPIRYRIDVATSPGEWVTVATDGDRVPFTAGRQMPPIYTATNSSPDAAHALNTLLGEQVWLNDRLKSLRGQAVAYAGKFIKPEPTFRLHRGEPSQPRESINPGGLASIGRAFDLSADAPDQERRIKLAEWIADPTNPLTARVIVNRIWHYHFGQGLVATPSDFGHMGFKPTHPELLDWLATELVSNGWRLKPLHKQIVMSATYRQSGDFREDAATADADATLLWRYPPRRLEAESLRDTVLAVSGKLNLAMGGPGFSPFKPDGNFVRVYEPRDDFGPVEWRRMVYQTKPRIHQDGTFGAFDCPDGAQIAPTRTSSTTPLQALNLLNSAFMVQQADFLAERVRKEAGDAPAAQVARLFRLAYGREPAKDDIDASMQLLKEHGLPALCRVVLNANEFLYVY